MLKKRLIAVLPIKNGIVVQSIGFEKYLPVGSPSIAVEYLNQWGIDEIVILDIEASSQSRSISSKMIKQVSQYTFSPLTVGGGIKNTEQMKELIASGADKISINRAAIEDPQLISRGAEIFGSQCIIVSMDVKKNAKGSYEIFIDSGKTSTKIDPVKHAKDVEKLGAGEIFVNFIDRDGSKLGYDLEFANTLSRSVEIPVIICGGVGHPQHFVEGLNLPNVSAVAAGNFFHYEEHSVTMAKQYITQHCAHPIRLDSYVNHIESQFDDKGRLQKKDDATLERLFFEFHPKEKI